MQAGIGSGVIAGTSEVAGVVDVSEVAGVTGMLDAAWLTISFNREQFGQGHSKSLMYARCSILMSLIGMAGSRGTGLGCWLRVAAETDFFVDCREGSISVQGTMKGTISLGKQAVKRSKMRRGDGIPKTQWAITEDGTYM